jgi:RHS repeat-associated protein
MRKSRDAPGFTPGRWPSRQRKAYSDGSTTYSYDLNGNRTMSGYSTGTDNRLTFDGTYTYTYNAEGDLTQKVSTTATWTYGWDNMNRLVGVKQVTATGTQLSVSYSYDVLGKRVEDDTWKPGTGTVTVRHAYDDNGNIWADATTTNTLLTRYVYGDGVDQVWARAIPAGLTNSGVAWYLTDRLGSVRDIMDSSSVIQDHIDYDGYGNATHTTISVADRFGYAGGLYSYDTKMEQFGARWYDAATGRWVNEDPSGFGGGDQNLYRYVGNNPTDGTDPSGLVVLTLPIAREILQKQIKTWEGKGWMFAGHLLQHFLDNTGIPYVPTAEDIAEAEEQSEALIKRVLLSRAVAAMNGAGCNDLSVGTQLKYDGHVRWVLSPISAVGALDYLGADEQFVDGNDQLFYTYGGADLKLTAWVTDFELRPEFPSHYHFAFKAKVTLSDWYDFSPPGKLQARIILFESYRTANYLQIYHHYKPFAHTLTFTKKYTIDSSVLPHP